MHMLPNISRSKGNQKMEFGQLIENNKRDILFKNHVESEAQRVVPDPFLLLKKPLNEVKGSGLQLSFKIYR